MKFRYLFLILLLTRITLFAEEGGEAMISPEPDNFPYAERAADPALTATPLSADDLLLRIRLNRLHKIAGYSTLAAGLLTGLTAPLGDDGLIHPSLGVTTASLSAVALGLGYAAHRGEGRSGVMSPADKIHALLGIAGGAMMVAAPFAAPSESHVILGGTGLAFMGIAVGWELVY